MAFPLDFPEPPAIIRSAPQQQDSGMQFPPEVERWRPLVEKYFPPHLVTKALWTLWKESGGNPSAAGDNGVARGLFQIQDNRSFASRPDAAYLDDPENNIRYAANELGAASGNFGAWGEGTTYNGQPFGAFGHNRYPGEDGGVSAAGGPRTGTAAVPRLPFGAGEYQTKVARYQALGIALIDPLTGGLATGVSPSDPRLQEMSQLQAEIQSYEEARDNFGGDYKTYLDYIDRLNENDPARIAAENAAARYGREFGANQAAGSLTDSEMQEQRLTQDSAVSEFNDNYQTGVYRVPSTTLANKDQVFAKNLARVKANLPEVPDIPAGLQPEAPFQFDATQPKGPVYDLSLDKPLPTGTKPAGPKTKFFDIPAAVARAAKTVASGQGSAFWAFNQYGQDGRLGQGEGGVSSVARSRTGLDIPSGLTDEYLNSSGTYGRANTALNQRSRIRGSIWGSR